MSGKPIFGLFDLDKAFDVWNGLKGEVTCPDLFSVTTHPPRDFTGDAVRRHGMQFLLDAVTSGSIHGICEPRIPSVPVQR